VQTVPDDKDLIYEGIATRDNVFRFALGIKLDDKDLIYEGIATSLPLLPLLLRNS